jgi:Domain of unknown function (DUF4372)
VARYGGDHKVKRFICLGQYLSMAFAQLTFRESLRGVSWRAVLQGLSLGLSQQHGGAQYLASANATRDWRIYCEFAQRLIAMSRRLYVNEHFGVDLKDTVYAFDATTIDLCLSVFPSASFRSTNAAIKLHTLLDLRQYPFFHSYQGRQVARSQLARRVDCRAGAFYVMVAATSISSAFFD